MTQITDEMPDPLGPYYVRFGPHPFRPLWRRALRLLATAAAGAVIGWLTVQAWAGIVHPLLGVGSFVYITVIFYPNLAMKMSHDIIRARMFHAIAVAHVEMARTRDLLFPREELGAQTL